MGRAPHLSAVGGLQPLSSSHGDRRPAEDVTLMLKLTLSTFVCCNTIPLNLLHPSTLIRSCQSIGLFNNAGHLRSQIGWGLHCTFHTPKQKKCFGVMKVDL